MILPIEVINRILILRPRHPVAWIVSAYFQELNSMKTTDRDDNIMGYETGFITKFTRYLFT